MMLWGGLAGAALPVNQPVITSLAIVGTNLDFEAAFPSGVQRAVLEMRPTLADSWQQAAVLDVPIDGGVVEFTFPKPAMDSAFFRLNATLQATSAVQVSDELQYVTVPPLGPEVKNAILPAEAVFHFKGMVDGSDRIVITHSGALWNHVNWGWPGAVLINDSQWQPAEKNFMTSTGSVAFLPEMYSLQTPRLEVMEGRDIIAMERTNDALIVYLDDTAVGAATYEFKIHFHPLEPRPAEIRVSTPAKLKIKARIDGSDLLKITAHEAAWTHRAYSYPGAVKLNDVAWDVSRTNVLVNAGTNAFLPEGVDLATARIIERQGRDLATMWADHDAIWVSFADNPNGADDYEIDLQFGK